MCQPSPRGRCASDAKKMLASKLKALTKEVENANAEKPTPKTDLEKHRATVATYKQNQKIEKLAEEVAEAEAFLHATPSGQKNPLATQTAIDSVYKKASPEVRDILENATADSQRTGEYLASFQNVAKQYARVDRNNAETARLMANGVFAKHRSKIHSALVESHKKMLATALSNVPFSDRAQMAKVRGHYESFHNRNVRILDKAFSYATEDAMDAVEKDRAKNSNTFENTIDEHKFGFYKNTDGSFTVRTQFDVQASNIGQAIKKAENSFRNEDVQITVGQPKNGVYTIDTAYVYKGGESIDDAQKFHRSVWNGTPSWRQTLAQTRHIEETYDEEQQQGRYAPGFKSYK